MLTDPRNSNSLQQCAQQAKENARTLQGLIPRIGFEYINELQLQCADQLTEPLSRSRRGGALAQTVESVQKIEGFLSANMLHDAVWNFFRLGSFIERADLTTRSIDLATNPLFKENLELAPFTDLPWRSVLRSLSAVQTHNHSAQAPITQASVLGFLFSNEQLPRSVYYCLNSLRNGLGKLPDHKSILTAVNGLDRKIKKANLDHMSHEDAHKFVDECQQSLNTVHNRIDKTYFQ